MHISESKLTYEIVSDIENILLPQTMTLEEQVMVLKFASKLKDLCYQRDYASFNSAA
ncbi:MULTISPECIES: hypothetical protein [Vibrio]|uniref:hypothetical protein n=1 Tax=Vibrio TaxID=662 RepID=UPI000AEC5F81|nr:MULTISPECIES: hypothetical protein [Vibrio]